MKLIPFLVLICYNLTAQPIPGKEENIPYLVTFGKEADKSFGDDDFVQTIFFKVPSDFKKPIYLRVYDPDVGGKVDEAFRGFNSKTKFTVYGGKGCHSNKDARGVDPVGNYKSGNMLYTKSFGVSTTYDEKWYTFGPINPSEGEFDDNMEGYIFKVIVEGVSGDDGNLYKMYMSSSRDRNISIEGGNAFTYEYCVRLHDNANEISHIYPFVDSKVESVKQYNFDWDNDGSLLVFSKLKLGFKCSTGGDDVWKSSQFEVDDSERGSCYDFQIRKNKSQTVKNNNVVFYVTNQYGEALPFYAVPIGYKPQKTIIGRPKE
jgi:hypothetical protein